MSNEGKETTRVIKTEDGSRVIGILYEKARVLCKEVSRKKHFMRIYQSWGISLKQFKDEVQPNADFIEMHDTGAAVAKYLYFDIRYLDVNNINNQKIKIGQFRNFEVQLFINTDLWEWSDKHLKLKEIRELFKNKEKVVDTPIEKEKKQKPAQLKLIE